jgi:hypothetical protein
LDKAIKAITKYLAKLFKKPDPFTGENPPVMANPAEATVPTKPQTLGEKIWAGANKVVETA